MVYGILPYTEGLKIKKKWIFSITGGFLLEAKATVNAPA